MKMNLFKFILFLVCVLAVSCSTQNKKSDAEGVVSKTTMSSEPIVEDSSISKVGKKEIKKAVILESPTQKKNEISPYDTLNSYIKNQDEESILKESSRILMQNANDVKALNSLAMVYYKKGQFGLSKSLLMRALKVNAASPNYEVYSNLGILSLAVDEKMEAIKYFKKALEINPNDSVSSLNVGSQYVKNNDFEKAVMAFEIPYKKGNKDPRFLSNYAVSLVGVGKYEKASAVYNEALKDNNQNKEILFNYLVLLVDHQKKFPEALELIQRLKFVGVPEESRSKFQELELIARKENK
ncbi:MAG: tetratricopeptide repeat protein [Bdellovibrionaceae bacterium]|nr:tetratricopeptide repeat protein [Pseudobdellovibrionaceae bacterium]